MKIDRLLGIVILLLNRKKMTAGELAEYFEVSERTIYRDIESLGRAGIPVTGYQGSGGGLGILEGFTLDRQLITKSEISSMITGLKGLSSIFDDERYITAREKMENQRNRRIVLVDAQTAAKILCNRKAAVLFVRR